jgi:glycine C-acetyltransferase
LTNKRNHIIVMYGKIGEQLQKELSEIKSAGLYKEERAITTPQGPEIKIASGQVVCNFCANNYLGLSDHPEVVAGAKRGLDTYGYGMSSVRFICGTQDLHKNLEKAVSSFLGTEDTILYSSCFDANGGLFETLFGSEDVIISDELNHASIIDGIRLSRAERRRYKNANMRELEDHLKATQHCRRRVIATDGVFSMDGTITPLDRICDLADRYQALVMVDDSHATGFIGKHGRGTPEHYGVEGRVDILTSTLGKALGGASGGFTTGRKEIIELLRQRSRPYLFSNSLPPVVAAAALAALNLISKTTKLRDRLESNTKLFRDQMTAAGFNIKPGIHPITPIMLGDAKLAADMARDLLAEGIYVVGFSYPVVPQGAARIRVQLSAAHTKEQIEQAVAAFIKVGKKYKVIG